MRLILQLFITVVAAISMILWHSWNLSESKNNVLLRYGGASYGFPEHKRNKTMDDVFVSSKPRLVFHMGPGKMGSSTLQNALIRSRNTLKEDGWVTYNHMLLGALNRCLVQNSCQNERKAFQEFLDQQAQQGNNIVLSTEIWLSESDELIWYQELFRDAEYDDVTIVVAYRRYYNWLPSRYYQLNRFRCRPNRGNNVNYGRGIPPLHTYLSHTPFDHPTVHKINTISKYFDNIHVINIETEDMIQTLFCDILHAPNTCHQLQSTTFVSTNQGTTLTFDRMAQYLMQHNMVNRSKVKQVAQIRVPRFRSFECGALSVMLEQYYYSNNMQEQSKNKQQQIMSMKVPLVCPFRNVTDRLFQVSAAAEQTLFPNEFSYDHMWNDFSTQLNTTLFCDVDVEAFVSDELWQPMFQELQ